ncbi:hypothetical protein FVE85_5816 [Porphyridium purpureum]|uniref:Uncharacterized protein n=1 Tax=Porphyridium purpureum TaxID=35688 RepID=A0A5J4Z2Y3_PORPP|nr:hypothetical protein FVE85_5816 [Porphyridium purpureum]|eukprot:POR2924..scf295_1
MQRGRAAERAWRTLHWSARAKAAGVPQFRMLSSPSGSQVAVDDRVDGGRVADDDDNVDREELGDHGTDAHVAPADTQESASERTHNLFRSMDQPPFLARLHRFVKGEIGTRKDDFSATFYLDRFRNEMPVRGISDRATIRTALLPIPLYRRDPRRLLKDWDDSKASFMRVQGLSPTATPEDFAVLLGVQSLSDVGLKREDFIPAFRSQSAYRHSWFVRAPNGVAHRAELLSMLEMQGSHRAEQDKIVAMPVRIVSDVARRVMTLPDPAEDDGRTVLISNFPANHGLDRLAYLISPYRVEEVWAEFITQARNGAVVYIHVRMESRAEAEQLIRDHHATVVAPPHHAVVMTLGMRTLRLDVPFNNKHMILTFDDRRQVGERRQSGRR